MLDEQRLKPSLATLENIEKATGIPIKDWLKQGGREMVSRRRQMQFERVGMDLEKVKHKVQKIIDECVAENFTMRESRLLAKELDYALDQIEMRSLDSEISKFTNSVTD